MKCMTSRHSLVNARHVGVITASELKDTILEGMRNLGIWVFGIQMSVGSVVIMTIGEVV